MKQPLGIVEWAVAVMVGIILGIVMLELSGIRKALEHFNVYNDATEQLYQCYHNYGYCTMEWDGDEYVITPDTEMWGEIKKDELLEV